MVQNANDIQSLPPKKPEVEHSSHLRMAKKFAAFASDRLIYVRSIGWHLWDGTRWAIDESGATERTLHDLFKQEWLAAFEIKDDDDRKKATQAIARCESASGIAGVLKVAATLAGLRARPQDLDAEPYLLNTPTGTLDLHDPDAGVRPHSPADRITKITRGGYDRSSPSTAWDAFLTQILPSEDVRNYLRRIVGVALLGKVVEHILVVLVGVGANGKTVTSTALSFALGDYSSTPDAGMFMQAPVSSHSAPSPGEMDLRGVRLAIISESGRDKAIDEARMKRLTGGDDITARALFKDFITFSPSHTPLLITNHLPKVSGDDPAVWRRISVIRFGVVIPADEQNGRLGEELEIEADAILTWAVDGWRDYLERGSKLDEPHEVLDETAKYRRDSDDVARFLADDHWVRLDRVDPDCKDTTGRLHAAYSLWAATEGGDEMSAKTFGKALDDKGYPVNSKTKTGRYRTGLARQNSVA